MKALTAWITVIITLASSFQQVSAQSADYKLVRALNPRYPTNWNFKTVSSTAKPVAVAIPLGMLAVSLIGENKKLEYQAYETVAGLAIATIGTELMKKVVNRNRPYIDHTDIYPNEIDNSPSFPSGHTSVAFSVATSVYLNSRKWYLAVPAFAWASGVGYSRIYLGQHYPSDVVAGALVGAGSAMAAHWLHKKFFSGKKPQVAKVP
jgi:membrane-associated phospholipid phosphatase